MTNKYEVAPEENEGLLQLLDCSSEIVGTGISA